MRRVQPRSGRYQGLRAKSPRTKRRIKTIKAKTLATAGKENGPSWLFTRALNRTQARSALCTVFFLPCHESALQVRGQRPAVVLCHFVDRFLCGRNALLGAGSVVLSKVHRIQCRNSHPQGLEPCLPIASIMAASKSLHPLCACSRARGPGSVGARPTHRRGHVCGQAK